MAFRTLSNGQTSLFYGAGEIAIYKEQVDLVMAELQESTQSLKPKSKEDKLRKKWWKYFEGMTHDGYGYFRLDFEDAILEYDEATLDSIKEDIFCLINETYFMSSVMTWQGIQNELEDFVDSFGNAEEVLELYIDNVLETGYAVEQEETEDIFCKYGKVLTYEDVQQKFLMLALAGKNVILKETQKELA